MQAPGDDLQQLVAPGMATGIIDVLEVIYVQIDEREQAATARQSSEYLRQPSIQKGAIRQRRQGILLCYTQQLLAVIAFAPRRLFPVTDVVPDECQYQAPVDVRRHD